MNDFIIDFGDTPAPTDPQRTACVALSEALSNGWKALTAPSLARASGTSSAPVRAFLLLDTWADNPLATELLAGYPAQARSRHAVPDEMFKNREDEAPCLVWLPEALGPHAPPHTPDAVRARQHLVDGLMLACEQARKRQVSQSLCGVIFSAAEPDEIVRHWASLGHQQAPDGSGARLFRYQDPRVMQRVWPLLTANQRQQWLGPVRQWWSLAQPWGPWAPDIFSSAEAAEAVPKAAWVACESPPYADRQKDATRGALRALFAPAQWHAAHVTPDANRVWQGYAAARIAADRQPDGDTVSRLLHDAAILGLTGGNRQDYVWCTWRHAAPPGAPKETPWTSEPRAAVLQKILKALQAQPDARFGSLYAHLTQQRHH